MNPEIILSLLDAEKGFTGDAMQQRYVESKDSLAAWDKLEALLTPLGNTALEEAVEYGAAKERDGFINGFRIATSLMMESLMAPPHGGGAAQFVKSVRIGHRREKAYATFPGPDQRNPR